MTERTEEKNSFIQPVQTAEPVGNRELPREYWNNIKGFLSCLVVIGHVIMIFFDYYEYENYPVMQGIINFVYIFHMPMFVFVSGFFSKNLEKRRNLAFRDLLVPYIVLQLCWMIFNFAAYGNIDVIKNIFYPQFGMWYLLALFIWRMILPDLIKIKWILPLSFVLYVIGMFFTGIDNTVALQRTIGFLCFFLLGYYFTDDMVHKIRRYINKALGWAGLAAGLACCIIVAFLKIINYETLWYSLVHNRHIPAFGSMIGGALLYVVILAATLVLMICTIAALPEKRTVFTGIGTDTMPLYLSQGFLLYIVIHFYSKFMPEVSVWVHALALLALSVLVIFLFSSEIYRKIFNGIMNWIKKIIAVKNN